MRKKLEGADLQLHRQFVRYGTNAKEWMQKCILLLPEIQRHKIWAKKRFGSIYEYAAKLAGMSQRQVDNALWVLNRIEGRSELMRVVEEKGVNAVRPIVTIATVENDKFLAEKARGVTVRELEAFAKAVRSGKCSDEVCEKLQIEFPHVGDFQPGKVQISMELPSEVAEQLKKLKGDKDWGELMKEFLQFRKEKLQREKPESVATESRHVPAEIDHFVRARDNNTCVFPGCSRACAELHHVDSFALAKVHDPDRIFCLCGGHHDLAHRGLIENEHLPPAFWRVRSKPDRASPRFEIDRSVERHRF